MSKTKYTCGDCQFFTHGWNCRQSIEERVTGVDNCACSEFEYKDEFKQEEVPLCEDSI